MSIGQAHVLADHIRIDHPERVFGTGRTAGCRCAGRSGGCRRPLRTASSAPPYAQARLVGHDLHRLGFDHRAGEHVGEWLADAHRAGAGARPAANRIDFDVLGIARRRRGAGCAAPCRAAPAAEQPRPAADAQRRRGGRAQGRSSRASSERREAGVRQRSVVSLKFSDIDLVSYRSSAAGVPRRTRSARHPPRASLRSDGDNVDIEFFRHLRGLVLPGAHAVGELRQGMSARSSGV